MGSPAQCSLPPCAGTRPCSRAPGSMAVGKNKRLSKGKKGGKRVVDPFTKKEWYDVKAPSMFSTRAIGKTLATRSQGTKLSSDSLKGRVFETCLADLQGNEEDAYRKMRLRVEDVQGRFCLTNFHGMDITTDKLRSLIKKRCNIVENHTDVRTADGYVLRIFVLAFTTKRQNQVRRTCYAKSSQLRQMRARMDRILHRESSSVELKDLVSKFIPEMLGTMIEKACQAIYPLRDVLIRKVKVLRAPKFDLTKLMEVHDNYTTQAGKAVAGASADAAANEDDGVPENVPGAEAA